MSTSVNLEGFNLRKIDDHLNLKFNFYQTSQKNEDNKTNPTVFPNIKYYSGNNIINEYNTSNVYEFYNIFRDKNTTIHSRNQQKISHKFDAYREFIRFNSKISFDSEIYNQIFQTEDKLIENEKFHTGTYYRIFPIFGISASSPFKFKKNKFDLTYNPSLQLVLTPGSSNSNKISNEDSSNNSFTLTNISSLNRYIGTDKMDNSKRINYGLNIYNDLVKFNLSQNYEFTDNSNFHKEQGNDDNLSDLLGSIEYNNINNINYNFRYDANDRYLKRQNINFKSPTLIGDLNLSYLDQKSKADDIITQDTETLNYGI